MGGTVIVTVRPGVQFTPDAAKAFQRAEAQVQAEFGRNIDVNSTYRDWNEQLRMFNAWQAYLAGGPKPNHSKALHPDDPLAFHTKGTALDSDDWVNARIVAILAENGFIRNRLYVPNEKHHFEYIRSEDKNYGKEIPVSISSEDVKRIAAEVVRQISVAHIGNMIKAIYSAVRFGKKGVRTHGDLTAALMSEIGAQQIYRATHGQAEKIDVTALAAAISDELDPVDAEKLANAILKAQGKALTDATRS